jgi:hypothetical protein
MQALAASCEELRARTGNPPLACLHCSAHTGLRFISPPKRSDFCSASRTGLLWRSVNSSRIRYENRYRSDAIRYSVNGALLCYFQACIFIFASFITVFPFLVRLRANNNRKYNFKTSNNTTFASYESENARNRFYMRLCNNQG